MSYQLDKKNKRKRYIRYSLIVFTLFIFIYFQSGIGRGLSYVGQFIFKPILITGENIGSAFFNMGTYFSSKQSLEKENQILKDELNVQKALMANYNSVVADKYELEAILGRKVQKSNLILGAVLGSVGKSPYDTLIIDLGGKDNMKVGDMVFAWGNIPIGKIAEVYSTTSKVILYSSEGEETEAVLSGSNIFMSLRGRGGGNFEMTLPRDFEIEEGREVVLPGLESLVVAQVDTIISDSRDAYKKALLSSPINIFELKFVQIEKQ